MGRAWGGALGLRFAETGFTKASTFLFNKVHGGDDAGYCDTVNGHGDDVGVVRWLVFVPEAFISGHSPCIAGQALRGRWRLAV